MRISIRLFCILCKLFSFIFLFIHFIFIYAYFIHILRIFIQKIVPFVFIFIRFVFTLSVYSISGIAPGCFLWYFIFRQTEVLKECRLWALSWSSPAILYLWIFSVSFWWDWTSTRLKRRSGASRKPPCLPQPFLVAVLEQLLECFYSITRPDTGIFCMACHSFCFYSCYFFI